MRARSLLRAVGVRAVLPLVVIAIWWMQTRSNTSAFFPSLTSIARTFREMWLFQLFGSDIVPSMVSLLLGFGVAVAAGIVVGAVLGTFRALGDAVEPLADFVRSIPPVAVLPIVIVFAGLGQQMDVSVIALAAVWPTLIATRDGLSNLDPQVEEVLRVYRIAPGRAFLTRLQSSALEILSGVQVSLQVSFILMVVSQIIGATGGIGYEVLKALQTYDAPEVWAGVVLLGIIGVALNLAYGRVQRLVLHLYGIGDERAAVH